MMKIEQSKPSYPYTVVDLQEFVQMIGIELSDEEKILKRNWKALQHYSWVCTAFSHEKSDAFLRNKQFIEVLVIYQITDQK